LIDAETYRENEIVGEPDGDLLARPETVAFDVVEAVFVEVIVVVPVLVPASDFVVDAELVTVFDEVIVRVADDEAVPE